MLFSPETLCVGLLSFVVLRLNVYLMFPHALLTGLKYTLPPTAAALAWAQGEAPKQRGKRTAKRPKKPDEPAGPKQMNLDLKAIEPGELLSHAFYHEFNNVIVIGAVAVVCGLFSEVWSCVGAEPQHQISNIFLGGASVLATWHLCSMVPMFGSDERVIVALVSGIAFIMGLFMVFPNAHWGWLDFDPEAGLQDAAARLDALLRALHCMPWIDLRADGVALAKVVLAAVPALLAGCSFLPLLRLARTYVEAAADKQVGLVRKTLLLANLFAPMLVALVFVTPLTKRYVVPDELVACGPAGLRDCSPDGQPFAGVTESRWAAARVALLAGAALLRLSQLRFHVQAFLLTGARTLFDLVERPNVKLTHAAAVTKVRSFYFLAAMNALQYAAPVVLAGAGALLLKRNGAVRFGACDACGFSGAALAAPPAPGGFEAPLPEEFTMAAYSALAADLNDVPVLTPVFWRGVLGYVIFWTAAFTFVMSVCGVMYWRSKTVQAGEGAVYVPASSATGSPGGASGGASGSAKKGKKKNKGA